MCVRLFKHEKEKNNCFILLYSVKQIQICSTNCHLTTKQNVFLFYTMDV